MELRIDLHDYKEDGRVGRRFTERGIIRKGELYLFIFDKLGHYSFPGGGKDEGEKPQETLIREMQEETGYDVVKDTIKHYLTVFERRRGRYDDILEMNSQFYCCQVSDKEGAKNLSAYEAEHEYKNRWVTLEEAYRVNKEVLDREDCSFIVRDTKVMEILLNEAYLTRNVFPCIPDKMKALIEGHFYERESIGCSGSQILMFDHDLVLKIENKREESDGEVQMLKWLFGKVPVPKIVSFHSDGEKNYILMTKLKGSMTCEKKNLMDGERTVKLLAKGLKMLWKVDISQCPRKIDLEYKLKRALEFVITRAVDLDNVEEDTFGSDGFQNPMELYQYLNENRPIEEQVLIHGDYCLPNVFIRDNEVSGFLDLGYCGIGDKWQDIALAVRSLEHNLCEAELQEEYPKLYDSFFRELGFPADEEKIRYYKLLDELF